MLHTKIVKIGPVVLEKKMLTHDDGIILVLYFQVSRVFSDNLFQC